MQILNTAKADIFHFLDHKQEVRNKFYPFDTHSPSKVRHNKVLVCNETNKISVYCAINCKRKLQKQCEFEPKRNITLKAYFAMQWKKNTIYLPTPTEQQNFVNVPIVTGSNCRIAQHFCCLKTIFL